jgi:hypothetical protein
MARDLILRRYTSEDVKEDLKTFFPLEYLIPLQLSDYIILFVTC